MNQPIGRDLIPNVPVLQEGTRRSKGLSVSKAMKPQIDLVTVEIEKLLKHPRKCVRLDASSQLCWYGRVSHVDELYVLRWETIRPADPAKGVIVKTNDLQYFISVVQRVLTVRSRNVTAIPNKKSVISTGVNKLRKRA